LEEAHGPSWRCCPLPYRYRPEALAHPARLEADTLYVGGGLYGNPAALAAVLARTADEPDGPATIVFNGDFHWLDVDLESSHPNFAADPRTDNRGPGWTTAQPGPARRSRHFARQRTDGLGATLLGNAAEGGLGWWSL
jgi:hypothetical protein